MQTPSYYHHEEFQNRTKKLEKIRSLGVEPFPAKHPPADKAAEISLRFEGQTIGHSEEAASGHTQSATLSGRLVLFRAMGKNIFAHLQDETGRLQVMFNRDVTQIVGFLPNEELSHLKFLEKLCDLGDILGVEGHLFRTQKGEVTLFAKQVTL